MNAQEIAEIEKHGKFWNAFAAKLGWTLIGFDCGERAGFYTGPVHMGSRQYCSLTREQAEDILKLAKSS